MADSQASSGGGGAGVIKTVAKGVLVLLVLLAIKVAFHPKPERPEVVCGTIHGIADFLYIDIAGVLVFYGSPSSKASAVNTLSFWRNSCKAYLTRSKLLNGYIDLSNVK